MTELEISLGEQLLTYINRDEQDRQRQRVADVINNGGLTETNLEKVSRVQVDRHFTTRSWIDHLEEQGLVRRDDSNTILPINKANNE